MIRAPGLDWLDGGWIDSRVIDVIVIYQTVNALSPRYNGLCRAASSRVPMR